MPARVFVLRKMAASLSLEDWVQEPSRDLCRANSTNLGISTVKKNGSDLQVQFPVTAPAV